jgi:hypothetical protein
MSWNYKNNQLPLAKKKELTQISSLAQKYGVKISGLFIVS